MLHAALLLAALLAIMSDSLQVARSRSDDDCMYDSSFKMGLAVCYVLTAAHR